MSKLSSKLFTCRTSCRKYVVWEDVVVVDVLDFVIVVVLDVVDVVVDVD